MIELSIVSPVYNESSNILELYQRLTTTLSQSKLTYEIIFINDGSTDQTLTLLKEFHIKDSRVKILSFSRNFGHQIAVSAGLDHAIGQAVLTMDSDLQDAPEDIPKFLAKWKEGYDGIYAIRTRRNESFIRTFFFKMFYRVFNSLSQVSIPLDAGDFCLMDRKVVNALKKFPERNRFIRGLRTWVGFKFTGLPQERPARKTGVIKHGLKRLFHIGFDGIFSFSYTPLRMASLVGVLTSCGGFILGLKILYEKLFTPHPIIGWTSIMVSIIFFSGLIILFLGLIGEYICRIYDEIKQRPLYIIGEAIGILEDEKKQ